MRRLLLVVLVLLAGLPAVAGDEPVKMTCASSGGRNFRCTASNVEGFNPQWTLYSEPAYFASGPTASFPAPREWAAIEMRIDDAEQTHRLCGMVHYSEERHHVEFTTCENW
jgi:hypothetical protein